MKIRSKSTYVVAALILGGVFLLACAPRGGKGTQRSAKTSATMETVEADYKLTLEQLDITRASLEDIVRQDQSDIKKAFENYSQNVDKMENLWKKLSAHSDNMNAQGKDYFEEWQKQGDTYTNPEIQALSEQRRSDLNAVFVEISDASIGVKGSFKAYMADITEIRTYLSTDLTPKGVESITPVIQKAILDGDDLKIAIEPVLIAIGKAHGEFALGGTR